MSESFCVSSLIFSTYFFVNYFKKRDLKQLFFSGLFLTWGIFLRPVFLPLLAFYTALLIFQAYTLKLPILKASLFFVASFIMIEGTWIIRNYSMYKKLVILTPSIWEEKEQLVSAASFIQSWGGDLSPGTDNSFLPFLYFGKPPNTLPDYIYTSKFNRDSLVNLIANYSSVIKDSTISDSDVRRKNIVSRFNEYSLSIKKEKPFVYYIVSPLTYLKLFLRPFQKYNNIIGYSYYKRGLLNYINRVYYVLNKCYMVKLLTVLYTVFYYCTLFFGILGMFSLVKLCLKNPLILILIVIPAYTILIHTVILRLSMNRYIMPAWPFLIACMAYFLIKIRDLLQRKFQKSEQISK